MNRMKSWHMPLAVVFMAATILLAGGFAVASNMGFKLNKGLVKTGDGQIGRNWTSIPYNSPYGTFGGLCTQTGLPTGPINTAGITRLDGTPGGRGFVFQTCNAAVGAGCGEPLVAGEGVQIQVPFGLCSGGGQLCAYTSAQCIAVGNPTKCCTGAGTGPTCPASSCPAGQTCAVNLSSIIIVGSHNPSLQITTPHTGAGQVGNYWFAVPYHTTAVTLNDVCVQAGMVSGLAERLDPITGNFTTPLCPSTQAQSINLVLGEHIRLRHPPNGVSFTPAHF